MEIVLQYFDGCPNWKTTSSDLSHALDGTNADVRLEKIETHDAAIARGFRGSPTVLVNGTDPFADGNAPIGLTCRIYRTDSGLAGSPSLHQLRAAITAATEDPT